MDVVFRADASLTIGTGHVMRSLTLATALRADGAAVLFVCREHDGHLCEWLHQQGFAVTRLPAPSRGRPDARLSGHAAWLGASWEEDAEQTRDAIHASGEKPDWLVSDHYGVDARWEGALRASVGRIMIIDDLADRFHDCDLLVDQNYYPDGATRYDRLVASGVTKLLGPHYALLREEFIRARRGLRHRDGNIRRVLVSFGGADAAIEIGKTLQAVDALAAPFHVDIVLGAHDARHQEVVETYAGRAWVTFYGFVTNLAEMIAQADLCIGAGGSTTWERCCLGAPSLTISMAGNQDAIAEGCKQVGVCLYLGPRGQVTSDLIARALRQAMSDPPMLTAMSERAVRLVDGSGRQRVVSAMQGRHSTATLN